MGRVGVSIWRRHVTEYTVAYIMNLENDTNWILIQI